MTAHRRATLAKRSRSRLLSAMALAVVPYLAGCAGSSPTRPGSNLFLIDACGDTFRVRIDNRAVAQEAESLIGKGHVKIISGIVRAGDGGFNAPWPWHLDPASIEFADVTIELCDGCPPGQENAVGSRFCPWSTKVLGRG